MAVRSRPHRLVPGGICWEEFGERTRHGEKFLYIRSECDEVRVPFDGLEVGGEESVKFHSSLCDDLLLPLCAEGVDEAAEGSEMVPFPESVGFLVRTACCLEVIEEHLGISKEFPCPCIVSIYMEVVVEGAEGILWFLLKKGKVSAAEV